MKRENYFLIASAPFALRVLVYPNLISLTACLIGLTAWGLVHFFSNETAQMRFFKRLIHLEKLVNAHEDSERTRRVNQAFKATK